MRSPPTSSVGPPGGLARTLTLRRRRRRYYSISSLSVVLVSSRDGPFSLQCPLIARPPPLAGRKHVPSGRSAYHPAPAVPPCRSYKAICANLALRMWPPPGLGEPLRPARIHVHALALPGLRVAAPTDASTLLNVFRNQSGKSRREVHCIAVTLNHVRLLGRR